MPRPVVATIAVAAIAMMSSAASAGGGAGTKTVRSANDTVKKLLRNKAPAAKVQKRLRRFLDVDHLGQLALGKHWDALSAEQQKTYLDLLRKLIEANYVKGLKANLDYRVDYTGEAKKGEALLVNTEITTKRNGRPFKVSVDYLLRKDGRAWRTFDVITDGVGLVENYRAQFNKIIKRKGFDDLLSRMRRKLGNLGHH